MKSITFFGKYYAFAEMGLKPNYRVGKGEAAQSHTPVNCIVRSSSLRTEKEPE